MKLVISAVNFTEGGPLKVLQDAVESAEETLPGWDIVVLVNRPGLINSPRVQQIALPECKKFWLKRLWFEWFGFKRISESIQPDLWLSLHDITPSVVARRQAVYCHNPSPFYRISAREAFLEPTLFLFCVLYKYIYGFNIHNNEYVIVQQDWIRKAFRDLYSHPRIVVARPVSDMGEQPGNLPEAVKGKIICLYPALPRVFKNFEVVCEAYQNIPAAIRQRLEIRLTIQGTENRYAKYIFNRFSHVDGLRFIGRQSREEMHQQYCESSVILFPSKLETWGLPISEAKAYGKPLLVADLPYAKESVGYYEKVSFVPPNDVDAWRQHLEKIALGEPGYEGGRHFVPAEPYASNWRNLWIILAKGL